MTRFTSATAFVLLGLAAAGPLAQHPAEHDQFGTVSFETSCMAAVAGDFNRAVAQLHSFEFRGSMEGFNSVLARDPACAVAYWGIALSYWGNPFAGLKSDPLVANGRTAVQKGLSTGSPTPRERGYLEAVAALLANSDTATHRQRTLAYASAMDGVQRRFPSDMEARIFYALAVAQTANPADKTYQAQLTAAGILEPLWAQHPQHPGLAHYIIHAYDAPPLAVRALDAARRYAGIAPSAPHALHMPSHTFTRVGFWKDSADTNILSEQAAVRDGAFSEALHAMDYQIYAYLQMSDDVKAREIVQRAPGIATRLQANAVTGAAPVSAGVYAAAAIPARFALERGAWNDAASLPPTSTSVPYADAVTHFARALGAARSGHADAASRDIDQLGTLRDRLAQMNDPYWREQVDIERRVALAWVEFAGRRAVAALSLMRAAADAEDATDKAAISPGPLAPARELLGEMLLESGDAKGALDAFAATMAKEPNRFRSLAGGATAAEQAGDLPLAGQYYRTLLQVASAADADRAELRRARAFVKDGR